MTLTQKSPYLRDQRYFPNKDLTELASQVDQAYIDIAGKVNSRTIGIFGKGFQTITGEAWYLGGNSQKQQTLRQVYTFTAAGNIAHGLNFSTITLFSKPIGSYTDGTNYYGCIYASSVAIAGQVTFYITPTNIVIVADAGAPAITKGNIILEWLSQF